MVQKNCIKFILTCGLPPSIFSLEQALDEIKSLYEEQLGHSAAVELIEKDAAKFSATTGYSIPLHS